MKTINNYIQEKLIINKNIGSHIEWKKMIYDWIDYWKGCDFEYMMEMIEEFLDDNEFDSHYGEDYEPLSDYEKNPEFIKLVNQIFQKFKDDNDKQIEDLQNRN